MVQLFVFDRLSYGNTAHTCISIQEKYLPIRLMAAKEDNSFSFRINLICLFRILALDHMAKIFLTRQFGVFETIDSEVLEGLNGNLPNSFGRKIEIIAKARLLNALFRYSLMK